MSESVKRITIDALPVSSAVSDEDIFIKSNQVETSKITAKAITEYIKGNLNIAANTQSDWTETDTSSAAYIKNKPTAMVADGGNADTVNNHTVESDVPDNAEFTDTVYTHPDSSVTPGTYKSVTVDKQGHVTGGSNPTTLSEYGIADAATKAQGEKADTAVQSIKIGTTEYKSGTIAVLPDYPTALPASDVYEWAKAETKPVYTASEVGADELGSANIAYENAKSYTDDRIAQLIGTSPENLDTIEELGSAISENQSAIDAIENAITNKADVVHNHDELYAEKSSEHTHENKEILDLITSDKISSWDNKSDFDGDYNSLTNIPVIPTVPTALKNPEALTFTGAASGVYDGSVAKSIEIPSVGNGTITITQDGNTKGIFTTNQSNNTTIDVTGNKHFAYGTCSTASSTAEKVVTLASSDFELVVGSMVMVHYSNTNTAQNPTLNVGGTGAKSFVYNDIVVTTTNPTVAGGAKQTILYVYDGTYWVWITKSIDNNTTYTNASLGQGYGTCATAEATTAKVVTLANYTLVAGGIIAVKFTYAVPANATMNINSKGAKAIYYKGSAITDGVINAGNIATFIYNGSQYILLAIDKNIDIDFILINQQEILFENGVATVSDERITADSLADVYFTSDTIDAARDADISVETILGSVVLTATTEPTGIIKATIRIRVV